MSYNHFVPVIEFIKFSSFNALLNFSMVLYEYTTIVLIVQTHGYVYFVFNRRALSNCSSDEMRAL